jgi:hypothetical protein
VSADLLRQAADRLDALADAAEPGPWFVVRIPGHSDYADVGTTPDPDVGIAVCYATLAQPSCPIENAAYIAAMSPTVGKALAAWLRDAADNADLYGPGRELPFDMTVAIGVRHALAVARVILGVDK